MRLTRASYNTALSRRAAYIQATKNTYPYKQCTVNTPCTVNTGIALCLLVLASGTVALILRTTMAFGTMVIWSKTLARSAIAAASSYTAGELLAAHLEEW